MLYVGDVAVRRVRGEPQEKAPLARGFENKLVTFQ